MKKIFRFFAVLLSLLSVPLLLSQTADAFSFSISTDLSSYVVNDTINATLTADTNMNNTNVSIFLLGTNGTLYNSKIVQMNTTLNTSLVANVTAGGDYILKANFTFNSTYYETSTMVKISRASTFVISTDKATYEPGGKINFTVKATDRNGAGVSGESITVRMVHATNDTIISSSTGTTSSAGVYSGQMAVPSSAGTYRLITNDWLAVKTFDVSAFDLVAYTGDSSGNMKTRFGVNDTAYVFVDLFSTNKTHYTNSETLSVNITQPNGTTSTSTYTYSGSRINTSLVLAVNGTYTARVQPSSITRYVDLSFSAQTYELRGSFESASRGPTNSFFPDEQIIFLVKVYNVSSGEVITQDFSAGTWTLKILDKTLVEVSTVSNATNRTSANAYRFNFTAPNTTSLYYAKVRLNDTEYVLDFNVKETTADVRPVNQEYSFKNVFVGSKQTVRILTTLSNTSGPVNITNISVLEIRNAAGVDIRSSLTINTTVINYSGRTAGLAEFGAPADAGWYSVKMMANNKYAGESWFLVKLYSVCSQLGNYKWFISANESAYLTVKVTEAKDVGFIEGVAGNVSSSGGSNSSFSNMYGTQDCYGSGYTTVTGSSSAGNATSNIKISVSKIINTQTFEDVTTKISSLPSNTTDGSGQASLNISAPTRGWDSGTYTVEFSLRDQNNNTDKGVGWFTVKNLWVNVWPKQYSGYWKWYFSPSENFTFDAYAYNSTGTWYSYGSGDGVGDGCSVQGVFYQGDGAEWFSPPKTVPVSNYNWTCANTTSPARGRFNLTITPTVAFKTGSYFARVKINTSNGLSDTGDGWFSVKAYNVYARTSSSNYYDSWYKGASDNVTLTVDITLANSTLYSCYWSNCPATERVNQPVNVSVRKIIRYDQWKPTDYASWKYNATISNGTMTAVQTLNTTNGTVNITIMPKGGSANATWETGYYSAVIEVSGEQGTETTSSWYEIRSFFVDITPVTSNGNQSKTSFTSSDNVTVNVSAASKPGWMQTYGVNITKYNTTIVSAKLSYYSYADGRMVVIPVTYAPSVVNGTATVNITPSSALAVGNWYSLELTLRDANGNEQTGYASFEIKDFTMSTQTANYRWEYTTSETIPIQARICDSGTYWCSTPNTYSGNPVNISISSVYRTDAWPYTSVSGWSATSGQANSSNSGTATVNITQNSALSSGSYAAEVSARYADGTGSVQKQNVWFTVKAFTFSANPAKWEFSMGENVTLAITADRTLTLSAASFTCGYWPDTKTFVLGSNLAANTTSISSGTTFIKFSPSGTTWSNGYCYGTLTATDGSSSSSAYISFNMKGFTLYTSPQKYNYVKNESVIVLFTTDSGQQVNITNLTLTNWETSPVTQLGIGSGLQLNATQFTSSAWINITPTAGSWPSTGYYSGEVTATDPTNPSVKQKTWISFNVPSPLTAWGYPVTSSNASATVNTSASSRNVTFQLTVNKYNTTLGYYVVASNVAVSLLTIEKEDCSSYPCSYGTVSGYTSTNGTTNSNGVVQLNIAKTDPWAYGSHRAIFFLNDSSIPATVNNSRVWFWVSQ